MHGEAPRRRRNDVGARTGTDVSAQDDADGTSAAEPPRRRRARRGATSSTVAREAGVSQSTVSRALRGDPRVREDTRRRVEETAARLGYHPSWLDGPAHAGSRTIGVVVSDLTNPFFPSLLDPVHDELRLLGYGVVLFSERTDIPTGQEALHNLLDRSIDGLLVTTATLDSKLSEALAGRELPVVLLNRYVDGMDVDRVVADNGEGGRTVARHVLDLGHRRIGVIRGPSNTSTSRDRYGGFLDVLQQRGLALEDVPGFDARSAVRPGLTGIAQIHARRDLPRRQKFRYDRLYIRRQSFWLDVRLVLHSLVITILGSWERRGTDDHGTESARRA